MFVVVVVVVVVVLFAVFLFVCCCFLLLFLFLFSPFFRGVAGGGHCGDMAYVLYHGYVL